MVKAVKVVKVANTAIIQILIKVISVKVMETLALELSMVTTAKVSTNLTNHMISHMVKVKVDRAGKADKVVKEVKEVKLSIQIITPTFQRVINSLANSA